MTRWPFHPLLLGAFPVLFLWSQNVDEVVPEEAAPLLAVTALGTVVLAFVVGAALRAPRRGALIASATAMVLLSYGHIAGGVPPAVGLAVAAAVLVSAAVLAARAEDATVATATRGANVMALVLVVTALLPLTSEAFASAPTSASLEDGLRVQRPEEAPDVWYVVLDRYGRDDSLAEVFDHDNTSFTSALEAAGFDVADQSLANYPKTAHSLAASLNLDYLDDLSRTVPAADGDNWAPVYRLLRDHRLGEALTSIGYDYVHLGSWWSPTATAVHATRVLTQNRSSEFRQVFETTTALPAIKSLVEADEPLTKREIHRVHGVHQLDALDALAADVPAAPRFVFAHVALPHEPYVFDEDGSEVDEAVEKARSRADNYVRQLTYLNARIEAFVAQLVANHPDAIVVIQADEGPHPQRRLKGGPAYRWLEAPRSDLREKFRILNATRLPDVADHEVPEDLTPVNTFRFILSRYFSADLDPLPDRSYVFPHEDALYTFSDVTDRLRGR